MPDVAAEKPLPLNREGDQGRRGRLRAFWHQYGQIVTGLWLIAVSAALLIVAIAFYKSQSRSETSAHIACLRSKVFGPPLARAYGRFHILTDEQLAAYRKTLPTTCP